MPIDGDVWALEGWKVRCFYLTVLFPVVTSNFKGLFMIKIILRDLNQLNISKKTIIMYVRSAY